MGGVRVLGVIIARGGSKGLPRKNLLPLAGKPLIAHTIEAALESRRLDRFVVSTEDREIAEVARRYGADVPFMRPAELATDDILVFPVLRHATGWLEEHEGYLPEYVLLLQPTTPLRTAQDIDNAIEVAIENDADTVVGYSPAKQHPYWMRRITEDGRLVEFLPSEWGEARRQELPPVGYPGGFIFIAKRDFLQHHDTFYSDKTYPYVFKKEQAIDIDTLIDLRLAELVLKEGLLQGSE